MVQTAVSDRESELEEEQVMLSAKVQSLEEETKRLTDELREAKIADKFRTEIWKHFHSIGDNQRDDEPLAIGL